VSIEEHKIRYQAAAHAMQTGVATLMGLDPNETTPKHLRVGVNNALIGEGVLAKLLLDKGVITEEEYWKELADMTEKEVESYKTVLKDRWPNIAINLH